MKINTFNYTTDCSQVYTSKMEIYSIYFQIISTFYNKNHKLPSIDLKMNYKFYRIWQFFSIRKFSILSLLNVMNRFPLDICWIKEKQHNDIDFAKKKSSFRLKIIL